ncbi:MULTISPECIES: cupin domain-containing protein [Turicibacter]|jgi:cupin domain protein|uniref:Cupin domain-containing protein n=2 Tax=Turicibacter sanguinis TaxID=154288 RepID=A0A173U575_9FIRM|nr:MULTISPECIES: cupin domain-containing protein [Turicibacter]EFF62773.1 cupin domain protein [Turicibacter sanguinis PC909]EGC90888.1 cupin domain protein [Turicibacter sp. HGF1]MBP3903001.1 cupin domain-containing protein [Turicibacter sp.]MCU7192124.1 cupin domain-containing protein [Turicibacter sanguinis]MCU7195643.1 cupin domain-containing protein [Turicibacter sanguinis]
MSQFYKLNELKEAKQLIANNPRFRTVCFNFEVGKGLPKHSHNGYATIHVIKGEISMSFSNGESYELNSGDFLEFDARIEHDVLATLESQVLVTISASLE